MQIIANQLYHVYNQGNNQETIFKERADYIRFLRKFRELILPYCDVLAYCLMPNHFHFLINTTEQSAQKIVLGGIQIDLLTNGFRKLLSEYASLFNEKYQRTGSLFRQKTKGKCLENKDENYPFICFHYIHQNPYKANLVDKMENWEFSSFQDYMEIRKGTLCRQDLAYQLVGIEKTGFYEQSYQVISDDKLKGIF